MKSLGYHNSGFVLARKGRQPELSGWYIVRCSRRRRHRRRRRQNTAPSLSNSSRRGADAAARLSNSSSSTAMVYSYPAQALNRFQKRLQVDPGDYSSRIGFLENLMNNTPLCVQQHC